MLKEQYFKEALKRKLIDNIGWLFSVLALNVKSEDQHVYIKRENGKVYANLIMDGEEFVELIDVLPNEPVFKLKDEITLTTQDLSNVEGSIKTTIGRAIVNYVTLESNFGNKIPFIDKKFDTGSIEKILSSKLRLGEVSVQEYIKYVNSCSYLQALSRVVTVAATPKNIKAPDGIKEFKKTLEEKYLNNHGKEWKNDPVLVGGFIEEMRKFDSEYLKDDPTLGGVITSKIKNNARGKMYLAFGMDRSFDPESKFVENSLTDGYPKSNTDLAAIFNGSRSASFNRGHETQKGGAVAKDLLRAAIDIKVVPGDCGTTIYKKLLVTPDNTKPLLGMYMKTPNGVAAITDPNSLIGKVIELRSPLYCKAKGKNFCQTCLGKNYENRETGINLPLTSISTSILTASLKAMHDTSINTTRFNIVDCIK